jgi:hypothetical protein
LLQTFCDHLDLSFNNLSRCVKIKTYESLIKFSHDDCIKDIYQELLSISINYLKYYENFIINNEDILAIFMEIKPYDTFFLLLNQKSLPFDAILFCIDYDYHLVKYIPERLLKKLFDYDSQFFIKLYESNFNCREYFSIIDIFNQTAKFRNDLFID